MTFHILYIRLVQNDAHHGSFRTDHDFLINRYNKLSDLTGDKLQSIKISLSGEDDSVSEDLVRHS